MPLDRCPDASVWADFGGLILAYPIKDMSGLPPNFIETLRFLIEQVIPYNRVLLYCIGGHGRTGSILAGLIALLEPDVEDPVEAVRSRYCKHAVETTSQRSVIHYVRQRYTASDQGNDRSDV